jgi:hypothetical protein
MHDWLTRWIQPGVSFRDHAKQLIPPTAGSRSSK